MGSFHDLAVNRLFYLVELGKILIYVDFFPVVIYFWALFVDNGEPLSIKWQFWSGMKDVSFCFEKILRVRNQNK